MRASLHPLAAAAACLQPVRALRSLTIECGDEFDFLSDAEIAFEQLAELAVRTPVARGGCAGGHDGVSAVSVPDKQKHSGQKRRARGSGWRGRMRTIALLLSRFIRRGERASIAAHRFATARLLWRPLSHRSAARRPDQSAPHSR